MNNHILGHTLTSGSNARLVGQGIQKESFCSWLLGSSKSLVSPLVCILSRAFFKLRFRYVYACRLDIPSTSAC
jgi:hypothetical protein